MNLKNFVLALLVATAWLLLACGGSSMPPGPNKPSDPTPTTVGTNPTPDPIQQPVPDPAKDLCAQMNCGQGQTCQSGKCEPTVNPTICDRVKTIAGEWISQYGEATITTDPMAAGCAVKISGAGALLRTDDRPIMAEALPIKLSSDGYSQEIRLEGDTLTMSYTDPGRPPVERSYRRKQ